MIFIEYGFNNLFSYKHYKGYFKPGLTLVKGWSYDDNNENGAGKSSLINKSIFWILFGQTILGTKFDKVMNRHYKEDTDGYLIFQTTETFKIHRGRKPNFLKLYIQTQDGWNDISDKDASSTQQKINQLLTDFNTLSNVRFFGQGRTVGYPEIPPSGRKNILMNILPFDKLNEFVENTTDRLKELNQQNQELEAQINRLNITHDIKSNLLIKTTNSYRTWYTQLTQYPTGFEYNEETHKLLEDFSHQISISIKTIEINKFSLMKEIANLKTNLKDCPTCGRSYDEKSKEYQIKILTEKEHQLQLLNIQLTQNTKTKNETDKQLETYNRYRSEIRKLNSTNPYLKEKFDLELDIKNIFNELQSLKTKQYEIQCIKSHTEKWLEIFKKDLPLYLFSLACPILNLKLNEHLNKLNLPQLHVECSTIKELTSGEIREEFDLKVWSDNGGEGYDSLSGGEQQMISFAFTMALADLAEFFGKDLPNVLILDEPFTMLSPLNCESIINYLINFQQKLNIYLISNDSNLTNLISNSILVNKKNGVSYVESETKESPNHP